jgi:Amt family ammonium transporter
MTPALALFYGGLGRRKNVLNTMMMSLAPMAIASILWVALGFTLSFSGHGAFLGNLAHPFMEGVSMVKATIFPGNHIPDGVFSIFQMMFSIIAVALLTGSVVGRIRFLPMLFFMIFWLLLVYYPLAHSIWGGGFLQKLGVLDFAGGIVIHISSGVTGLVLALFIGRRRDYKRIDYRPHNIPFVVLGTGLLWFGWFGFNSGSALGLNAQAGQAFLNTNTAAACAMLVWMLIEYVRFGKMSAIGACTGAIVGLATITPAAGFVPLWAAMIIGALASPVSFFMMTVVKSKFNYDDSLDVFGCHGVGGMLGSLLVGVFAVPSLAHAKGLILGSAKLLGLQFLAVVFAIVFSAVVSWVLIKIISLFTEIRVSERAESLGLDDSEHEETAYPTFLGLDS